MAIGNLSFEAPDEVRFPALRLAREALRSGGTAPAVLNAANEIAVEAFLAGRIGFLDIARNVADTLEAAHAPGADRAPRQPRRYPRPSMPRPGNWHNRCSDRYV